MAVGREKIGTAEVVHMSERIEVKQASEIKEVFLKILQEGTPRIVVDLSETRFVASAGIGLFATLVKECRSAGGECAFVNPNEIVLDILRVTKLLDLFKITKTVDDAVKIVEES